MGGFPCHQRHGLIEAADTGLSQSSTFRFPCHQRHGLIEAMDIGTALKGSRSDFRAIKGTASLKLCVIQHTLCPQAYFRAIKGTASLK